MKALRLVFLALLVAARWRLAALSVVAVSRGHTGQVLRCCQSMSLPLPSEIREFGSMTPVTLQWLSVVLVT
jgi:hypothetical protein